MKLNWRSFVCAGSGLVFMMKTQVHARWHALVSVGVVVMGCWLKVERMEWVALLLAMGLVWVAEAFNTAMEQACDAVTLERHPLIGRAKDVAAGAVLLAAVFAVVIGVLVLGVRVWERVVGLWG